MRLVSFTAVQAAQKVKTAAANANKSFTAVQAAQKLFAHFRGKSQVFTAVQAAQKDENTVDPL